MNDAYAKAGVSIDAANEAVARYRNLFAGRRDPRVLEGIGGFGGCFEFRGYRDPVLVASMDGVGTKVLVAAALERFDTIGRDLVHHCINDILCVNARPLFFLDYFAVGKLDPEVAAQIVSGIARACEDGHVALLGGETAEMPGVYGPGHFDIAGTIVGAVERSAMIDTSKVSVDDIVIGLPSNGFHTNGYSLVRRVIAPERWGERVENGSGSIGDALLATHPSYLSYVTAVQEAGVNVKAMAHITGGGLLDNVARVLPAEVAARFDRRKWSVPPVIAQVVREASLTDDEAYRTFNMGVGFCLIVAARDADVALSAASNAIAAQPVPNADGRTAAVVGEIEPRHPCGPAVVIS